MNNEDAGAHAVGAVRYGVGSLGLLLMGIGAWQLSVVPDPWEVGVWLVGALVLHDALIAPLVLVLGFLVAAVPARGVVRGALITGGATVLITLPLLLRPGSPPNPSALPLPYGRNLLLVLGAVVISAVVVAVAGRHLPRRPRGGGGPAARPQPDTGSRAAPDTGSRQPPEPGSGPQPSPRRGPGDQAPGTGNTAEPGPDPGARPGSGQQPGPRAPDDGV